MTGQSESKNNETGKETKKFPSKEEPVKSTKIPIHEFMVDLLGGLVPGALFVIGALISLLPTIYLAFCLSTGKTLSSLTVPLQNFFKSVKQTPNMIWISVFAFTIAASYVLGHLFYRNGPKAPDRKSFSKHAMRIIKKEAIEDDISKKKNLIKFIKQILNRFKRYNFSEYEDTLKKNLACTSEQDCEFPYPYLKDYLGYRGLCHLCPFVVWKGEKDRHYRSKTYINLLKIRLKYHFPQKCSTIIRNEAHVRLASSSWYVAKALRICSIIGILIVLPIIVMRFNVTLSTITVLFNKIFFEYISYLIYPFLIWIGAEYIRSRVEQFIHYQRIREVVYVLETAYTAFAESSIVLKAPFSEYDFDFKKSECKHACDYKSQV